MASPSVPTPRRLLISCMIICGHILQQMLARYVIWIVGLMDASQRALLKLEPQQ